MKQRRSTRAPFNWSVTIPRSGATALASVLGLLLIAAPTKARAFDFALKLEPGVAVPLSTPQSDRFNTGGTAGLKMMMGLGRYVDLSAGSLFVGLPAGNAYSAVGTAWAFGGGLRLKRPHDAVSAAGMSPWIDADAYFVRTGPLDRFAFDVAAGLAFPVDKNRRLWMGPFVRYLQIAQPDQAGADNRDAKIFIVGLSVEVTVAHLQLAHEEEPVVCASPEVASPICPECAVCVAPTAAPAGSDRDGDGVIDTLDFCPDVPGPIANHGCPDYGACVVSQDKILLNEEVFFAWDKDLIEDRSFSALDAVVTTLKSNALFQIRVEGNTDSTGPVAHNKVLSNERAASVVNYLVAHGIDRGRLSSKGFAATQPTDTNATVAGRADNRRVDFVILSRDGSVK